MTAAKYPRTPHLPWSPGGTRDDRRLASVSRLLDQELVITEKLDVPDGGRGFCPKP